MKVIPISSHISKEINKPFNSLVVSIWSIFNEIIFFPIHLFSKMNSSIFKKIGNRVLSKEQISSYKKTRDDFSEANIFFCSSAGEYEQAIPLMERLEKKGAYSFIIFFSISGYNFANARNEKRDFILSPPDSLFRWRNIFTALKPNSVFVVRHELWPAFLMQAKKCSKLYLLYTSSSISLKKMTSFKTYISKKLYSFFNRIYLVSHDDFDFYTNFLSISKENILISGDGKYDRVLERSSYVSKNKNQTFDFLNTHKHQSSTLIIGSAWLEDVKISLAAIKQLKLISSFDLKLIIALHQPSEQALRETESLCQTLKLSHSRLSTISKDPKVNKLSSVILVDSIGLLSDLYAFADLALVGGALHYQVHNVLEPACYALPLAFGPLYKNSIEAKVLVKNHAATIINDEKDLQSWWKKQINDNYKLGKIAFEVIRNQVGASDIIYEDLKKSDKENGKTINN